MANDAPDLSGHRERLRQRAETEGFENLRPREMVELILCYAVPLRDLSGLSRTLLDRFGSVNGLLHATREELLGVNGVGEVIADWLLTVSELVSAYAIAETQPQTRIECLSDALMCCKPLLTLWQPPCCGLLLTDFENRLMLRTKLCEDAEWAQPERVREGLLESLAMDARRATLVLYKVALAFSEYDTAHILPLARALQGIGVMLTDCICITKDGYRSLAMEGGFRQIEAELAAMRLREDSDV